MTGVDIDSVAGDVVVTDEVIDSGVVISKRGAVKMGAVKIDDIVIVSGIDNGIVNGIFTVAVGTGTEETAVEANSDASGVTVSATNVGVGALTTACASVTGLADSGFTSSAAEETINVGACAGRVTNISGTIIVGELTICPLLRRPEGSKPGVESGAIKSTAMVPKTKIVTMRLRKLRCDCGSGGLYRVIIFVSTVENKLN